MSAISSYFCGNSTQSILGRFKSFFSQSHDGVNSEIMEKILKQRDRAIECLNESNYIEGIRDIDYSERKYQNAKDGHWAAHLNAQSLALEEKDLSVEDLCRWQGWITSESLTVGEEIPNNGIGRIRSNECPYDVRVGGHIAPGYEEVPQLINKYVKDLNKELENYKKNPTAIKAAKLIGGYFQRFEKIHPFVDGNGRTGRVLANFIATRCQTPLVVFRFSERERFYAAHKSQKTMSCFVAKKIREAIFGPEGNLYLLADQSHDLHRYLDQEGNELKKEWRDLIAAENSGFSFLSRFSIPSLFSLK